MNFAHVGDTPEVIVPLDGAETVRNALGVRRETDRIDLDASSRGAGLDDEATRGALAQGGACHCCACHTLHHGGSTQACIRAGRQMSDAPQGPGWWQASDGKWYEPERHPSYRPPPPPATLDILQPATLAPQPPYYPAPAAYPQPQPIMQSKQCFGCGAIVFATAAICPRCGTMLGSPKDKAVAVLMAIFVPPWNWLYTYKRDAVKFWVGLSLMVVGTILLVVVVGFFLIVGVWLWAIIDAGTKTEPYYRQFPNGPA